MSHHVSESECESESGSGSECEEEEQKQNGGQQVWTQRSEASQLISQRGGAGGPLLAQENYFAQLTELYNRGFSLDDSIGFTSPKLKPKQWEEKSGCTCNEQKFQNNTNRGTWYTQNNNHDLICFSQKDGMIPISSKHTSRKKGQDECGYAYYENKMVKNGSVEHARDLRYSSQEDYSNRQNFKPKLMKEKVDVTNAYEKSKFDNNQHVGYGANSWGASYANSPPNSKPKLNRGKMGTMYAYDENKYAYDETGFNDNQYVGYSAKNWGLGSAIPPPDSKLKQSKGKAKSKYAYDESYFDNNQYMRDGAESWVARCAIPPPSSKTQVYNGETESDYDYGERKFDNNQHVEDGRKGSHGKGCSTITTTSVTKVNKKITYM